MASCLTGAKTAWDLLREEKTMKRIVTFCEDLDVILGGGICCKEVTEVGKYCILRYTYSIFVVFPTFQLDLLKVKLVSRQLKFP